MLKVISVAHGQFSGIRQVAPACTPPNTCFLCPIRVQSPNGISIGSAIFGRPFVKRFTICIGPLSVLSVCLSCLSVTLVYCGQTVECIKIVVGLGPGHIVLDGKEALPSQKGHSPQFSAHVVAKRLDGLRCHFVQR